MCGSGAGELCVPGPRPGPFVVHVSACGPALDTLKGGLRTVAILPALALLAGLLLLLTTGCQTDKPPSARFASVQITNNTPGQISQMAVTVFTEQGWKVAHGGIYKLVFEREASTLNQVAYGNWEEDKRLGTRVKASIIPVREMVFRLQCHVFMVRDMGSPAFEEEVKLFNVSGHAYQKLLDEVARRLSGKKTE
jgi:hypothetical protein